VRPSMSSGRLRAGRQPPAGVTGLHAPCEVLRAFGGLGSPRDYPPALGGTLLDVALDAVALPGAGPTCVAGSAHLAEKILDARPGFARRNRRQL
jgi:hypothetical protein